MNKTRAKSEGIAASEGADMLIDERRGHILRLIERNGRVLVTDLSGELGISQITIRKDLDFLQSKGLIQRSHGGALRIQPSALIDPTLQDKQEQHTSEKRRIAAAALELITEQQCIILDSGTTTTAIAEGLKRHFTQLTVITNAVNIASELAGTTFDVILVGGSLRKNSFSLVGPLAEDNLEEMHADILFLGVDGFDPEIGITTPNFPESRVNRAMVKAAAHVVVVCDSSKFHRRSLSRIAPSSSVHHVITDSGVTAETADALRAHNIKVTVV